MSRRNPYKLFDFYTDADADVFFGREAEVSAVVGDILANKLLVLFARSGSGKTSLLNAGIGPALREVGRVDEDDPGIRMVTIRLAGNMTPEQSALKAVRNALGSDIPSDVQTLHESLRRTCSFTEQRTPGATGLVLVFDQFEELFISLFKDHPEVRREFAERLAQIIHDDTLRAYVVLSLRSDHFHHLNEFRNLIPSIFQNNTNLELRPFDDEAALRVIRGPAEGPDTGFDWEEGLPERIVTDLKPMNEDRDGVLPIHLQIVCHGLWESLKSDEHQITLQHYKAAARLNRHAANPSPAAVMIRQRIIAPLELVKGRKRRYLLRTLRELITHHQTKAVRSLSELVKAIPKQRLMPILEHLEGALLLRRESAAEDTWFELRHDYLARAIAPWMEAQERALKARDRRLLEGIMAVFVIAAVVGTKLWYDWNSYVAEIGSPAHPDELIISRQPAFSLYTPSWWRLRITTGFLRPQLQAGGAPKYHFEVPRALADWSEVEPHLHEQDRWALQLAARLMGRAGGESADLVRAASVDPVLFEAIRHDDIGLYAAADPRILAFVKQVLGEGNAAAKHVAVNALGAAAESLDAASAQAVVADLRQALKDADADVRGVAAKALGAAAESLDAASAQAVVTDLLKALMDTDPYARSAAADALGTAAECLDAANAQAVVTDLLQALKDADADVRRAAAGALETAAESLDAASAQAVVADLRQALMDTNPSVRRAAAGALGATVRSLEAAGYNTNTMKVID